jgi:nucleotide-binding universal stress UspA family protein
VKSLSLPKGSGGDLKFIKEGSVELMAMGAYGHNRLREWLWADHLHHHSESPVPVLLIR